MRPGISGNEYEGQEHTVRHTEISHDRLRVNASWILYRFVKGVWKYIEEGCDVSDNTRG